mmetsp:Transcript_31475/g.97873  ORF Transcript_31475/g.97873 Transcript_31475/m.97873 type:complete len:186 (+) Transcript_31475:486-1043(+)
MMPWADEHLQREWLLFQGPPGRPEVAEYVQALSDAHGRCIFGPRSATDTWQPMHWGCHGAIRKSLISDHDYACLKAGGLEEKGPHHVVGGGGLKKLTEDLKCKKCLRQAWAVTVAGDPFTHIEEVNIVGLRGKCMMPAEDDVLDDEAHCRDTDSARDMFAFAGAACEEKHGGGRGHAERHAIECS